MNSLKKENVHDFSSKLLQPSLIEKFNQYLKWQKTLVDKNAVFHPPDFFPVSINLDLTTACNYNCDHCIDSKIINQSCVFNHESLISSLDLLSKKGLKSVILIGGGEPTLYPRFEEIVRFLKSKNLDVAIVSNGTGLEKIENIAGLFTERDWITLSLDAGTEETFQKIHNPKISITLQEICAKVKSLKQKCPSLSIRYAYVVRWNSPELRIKSNIEEIPLAAELARENNFDFLALKAYLERDDKQSTETIKINSGEQAEVVEKINKAVEKARSFETGKFKIRISTNLKALQQGTFKDFRKQPKHCHVAFFRTVLSPLGVFICPGFRGLEMARIGDKDSFSSEENYKKTLLSLAKKLESFDASQECKNVTCLYNDTNLLAENLIANKLDSIKPSEEKQDYFL